MKFLANSLFCFSCFLVGVVTVILVPFCLAFLLFQESWKQALNLCREYGKKIEEQA